MKTFLLVTILIVCFNCKPKNDQEAAEFFLKGNLFYAKKEYKNAELMYFEALEKKLDFVDAMNNLGLVYQKQGKTEEALIQFEKALSLEPTFTMAIYNRSESLYNSKNFDACISDLQEVEKAYKDSFFVYQSLGNVYLAKGNIEKALENYQFSLTKNKNAFQTYINRGVLFFDRGDFKKAKSDFESSLAIDPNNDYALNNLANVYISENNFELALKNIDKAINLKPADPIYLNNKGLILIKTKKTEEGLALIERSLRIMPENATAIKNKGIYYLEKQDFIEANKLFRSAKLLDPNILEIDNLISRTNLKKK